MNLKRSFVLLLILTATLMVLSACGGSSERGSDDVVNYFKDNDFSIGEKQEKAYTMVGAEGGFGIDLNGTQVELYIYDKDSSDLADIKADGEYDMEIFMISAVTNGNLVLMSYDGHPDEDKLVKLFNDF